MQGFCRNKNYMLLIPDKATPITNEIIVDYPILNVKQAIAFLLKYYSPKYFIPIKNGINHTLGTYVFSRPKGINTPIIRLTLQQTEDNKTKIVLNSSTDCITVTPSELQTSISEVENIVLSVLKGAKKEELDAIIKSNNSGNGCFSCIQSIGCVVFVIAMIFILGIVGLNCILNLF